MLKHYIKLLRPRHWVKNIFVLMPAPFALAGGAALDLQSFALGFFGFCLGNSAVYAFNDALDAPRDRLHETKQYRPVASGAISVPAAFITSAIMAAGSLGMAFASGFAGAVAVLAIYLLVNLVYCLGAKHVPLLDVFLLSSGFMLRFFLGCVLLDVPASNWLLLCSYCLALFLALAKRRADKIKGVDDEHRPALAGYTPGFLDQACGITACMSIIAYSIYTIDANTFVPGREFASVPFVVFGMLDYLRVAHLRGEGGNPVDLFFTAPMLGAGAGWLIAVVWSFGIL